MSDTRKRSDWIPADIDPVRIGWYELQYNNLSAGRHLMWFDGVFWLKFPRADTYHRYFAPFKWRGLVEKPE